MAACQIDIDGVNVTGVVEPYLESLRVSDRAGDSSAQADLELMDPDGRVLMPAKGALMVVALGASAMSLAIVFTGKVDEVRSRGGRGQGRTLSVSAKEIDASGKVKQTQNRHFDDKTVKDVLTEAGAEAGVTDIQIDEALGAIKLPYAVMQDESFLAFGKRLASELSATFKVTDTRATFTARNGGGMPFPTVTATEGDNLLGWDIAPSLGRPRFKKARARWHDPATGKTSEVEEELEFDDTEAETTERFSAPDEDSAKRRAQSAKAEIERDAGGGSLTIMGDTNAQPEGTVTLIGARPGIDGTYVIDGLTHVYSRSGFQTSLEVKRPSGSAGQDSRGEADS